MYLNLMIVTYKQESINIWKRQTGELLTKIPGSGFNSSIMGHSNVINQVDGSPTNPYLFRGQQILLIATSSKVV